MNRALNECAVTGIPTTINFHLTLLNKSKFKQGKIHTKYVEEELLPNYWETIKPFKKYVYAKQVL